MKPAVMQASLKLAEISPQLYRHSQYLRKNFRQRSDCQIVRRPDQAFGPVFHLWYRLFSVHLQGLYLINIFIPSASAKAAITMPVMAPFSDMIGISRQTAVLAFQFGDGFTNMITPCSGVLLAVLSIARIPYAVWVRWIWKFILVLLVAGFLLLLPTLYCSIAGF